MEESWAMSSPDRGEVWLVDLGMVAKIRPCLVRGTRFEVNIKANFLKSGVFDAQNPVTIPQAKLIRKLGTLTKLQIDLIEVAVRLWLGL
jgi:mRNA interferase MazF